MSVPSGVERVSGTSAVAREHGPRAHHAQGGTNSARFEVHVAVAVLCSELAHEIAPSLALLRDLVRSHTLPAIDHSIAEDEVARLETVIASLRRTKRAAGEIAPVDLASVAHRAVERAIEEAGGAVAVSVDVPAALRVNASEPALELMLVCLVRNAIDAGDPSGTPHVAVRAREDGDAWSVDVEDGGPGIDEALEGGLFMPLATLGPSGRGTGIPVVLRVVRDHGWNVTHARRAGRTIVTVTFAPGDASPASQP